MDLLGIVGLAECEMILDPERGPLVLEVNPRIAGTAPLSAAASGLDLHRCLVDMALGRCNLDRLRGEPACAVQIPVRSKLDAAGLARLGRHDAVRFVKPINWAPHLGISASLTVARPTPQSLLDALHEIDREADLQPCLDELHTLLGA
jgi:biotin carboxylase